MNNQLPHSVIISLFAVEASFASALMKALESEHGVLVIGTQFFFAVLLVATYAVVARRSSKESNADASQNASVVKHAGIKKIESKSRDAKAAESYISSFIKLMESDLSKFKFSRCVFFNRKSLLKDLSERLRDNLTDATEANNAYRKAGSTLPALSKDISFNATLANLDQKLLFTKEKIETTFQNGLHRKKNEEVKLALDGLSSEIRGIWAT